MSATPPFCPERTKFYHISFLSEAWKDHSYLQGVQLDTDSGSNSQMDKGGVNIYKFANGDLTWKPDLMVIIICKLVNMDPTFVHLTDRT